MHDSRRIATRIAVGRNVFYMGEAIERIDVVVGLTGPFGVGCTTAAKHLRDHKSYELIRLSDVVRREWEAGQAGQGPSRLDLQRLGDELRRQHGNHVLAQRALEHAATAWEGTDPATHQLVVDGIRNTAEVAWLRDRFGSGFTLLAVIAPQSDRWDRIENVYTDVGLNNTHFLADDRRDRNEEVAWGQQVELCVDLADVVIYNGADRLLPEFKEKVVEYVELVSGENVRHPTQDEILMNMAYSSRHSSKCAKRHVGAILVGVDGHVIGVGYNENPLGTNPCIEEPKYEKRCYRDIVRNRHFRTLAAEGAGCPACGEALPEIEGPPWHCQNAWN